MAKQVIFLWHNGGRLANQLWPAFAAYAYCLERGYRFKPYFLFEYARFFEFKPGSAWVSLLYWKMHDFLLRFARKVFFADPHDSLFRKYYKVYVKLVTRFRADVVFSDQDKVTFLSSSGPVSEQLTDWENGNSGTLYLMGWLFRNPEGLMKHREQVVKYFAPKADVVAEVEPFMKNIRKDFSHVVGLHIRQGDYKHSDMPEMHCFSAAEAASLARAYLSNFGHEPKDTCFVVCSDGAVDLSVFSGLNVRRSNLSFMEDLFVLAACDAVMGSNSTFGPLAAYYGNVPFITMRADGMEWDYYRGRKEFFFDKYATLNRFQA